MKFVFWIAVLAIVFFLIGFKRGRPRAPQARPPAPSAAQARTAAPEAMVSCDECGAHLPASESLPGRGGQFCCAEHRAAHESRST